MKNIRFTFLINDDNRIDTYFDKFGFESRSNFKNTIDNDLVLVNGKPVKPNYKFKENDSIEIVFKEKEIYDTSKINIDILYEDENLLVINKPPFVAVHGAKSYNGPTVVDYLIQRGYKLSTGEGEDRPGVVHRLDKDTSGALIILKEDTAHKILKEDFKNHNLIKRYFAISNGKLEESSIIIDSPIGRSKNPVKIGVVKNGRAALSKVKLIKSNENYSFLDVEIKTGRTHQIRVHLSSINLPIVGDSLYGLKSEKVKANRQMLHAHFISFTEPITGEKIEIEAPMFDDMKDILRKTGLK